MPEGVCEIMTTTQAIADGPSLSSRDLGREEKQAPLPGVSWGHVGEALRLLPPPSYPPKSLPAHGRKVGCPGQADPSRPQCQQPNRPAGGGSVGGTAQVELLALQPGPGVGVGDESRGP